MIRKLKTKWYLNHIHKLISSKTCYLTGLLMYGQSSYKLSVDILLLVHSEVMRVWWEKKESLKRKNSNFNVSKPAWVRFHVHLLKFYHTETYTLNIAWNLEEFSPCLKIAQLLEFKNMFMLLSQTKLPTCKANSGYLFLQMDPDISNNNPELGGTHQKVSYRQHPAASHI